MKNYLFIVIALIALLCTSSCVDNTTTDKPTSQVNTAGKVFKLKSFVDVNVVGSMQVFYTLADANQVSVEASKDAFDELVIYVKENELYVTSKNDNPAPAADTVDLMKDVKVHVSSTSLREISITGSGTFTSTSPLSLSHLDIDLTGAGSVNIQHLVDAKTFDAELTGNGTINVAQLKCSKLRTQVTGLGKVSYYNVTATNAESTVVGNGTIAINGDVENHNKTIIGTGSISLTN